MAISTETTSATSEQQQQQQSNNSSSSSSNNMATTRSRSSLNMKSPLPAVKAAMRFMQQQQQKPGVSLASLKKGSMITDDDDNTAVTCSTSGTGATATIAIKRLSFNEDDDDIDDVPPKPCSSRLVEELSQLRSLRGKRSVSLADREPSLDGSTNTDTDNGDDDIIDDTCRSTRTYDINLTGSSGDVSRRSSRTSVSSSSNNNSNSNNSSRASRRISRTCDEHEHEHEDNTLRSTRSCLDSSNNVPPSSTSSSHTRKQQQQQRRKSKSKRRSSVEKPKRRVTFKSQVRVRKCLHHLSYTDEEWKNTWFTDYEMNRLKLKTQRMLEAIESGDYPMQRGLECHVQEGSAKRTKSKDATRNAVLDEQDRQRKLALSKPDAIARASCQTSVSSRTQALIMGMMDHQNIVQETDKKNKSCHSRTTTNTSSSRHRRTSATSTQGKRRSASVSRRLRRSIKIDDTAKE